MDKPEFNYEMAFSRNIGLLTETEQNILRSKKVAIPGCGGVGGIHALTLARMGIGHFVISDFDHYGIENMNRQWGSKMSTIGMSKVEVMASEIKEINPEATVDIFDQGVNEGNIHDFLNEVDVVVDSLDFFAFDARELLFTKAYDKSIPVVTGGPIGFSCALLVFTGYGLSFKKYFDFKDSDTKRMKAIKFFVGLAPKPTHLSYVQSKKVDFDSGKGPSNAVGVTQCASFVCGQVLKLLIGRGPIKAVPHFFQFDVYKNTLKKGYLPFGNKGPLQKFKIWYIDNVFLKKDKTKDGESGEVESVQIDESGLKTDELHEIVRLMMRAPTGDNCQHWHFHYRDTTLYVYHDSDRGRHVFNAGNHASKISLGAVLESAKIAASQFGYRVEDKVTVKEVSEQDDSKPWAEIKFIKDNVSKNPMFGLLDLRASDRRVFKGGGTDHWVFSKVKESCSGFSKAKVSFCSDFNKDLLEYFAECDTFVWKAEQARQDLYRWIRFSLKDALKSRDGFQWQSLGVPWVLSRIVKMLRPTKVQQFMNKIGFLNGFKAASKKGIQSSASLVMISVSEASTDALIDAGRALQTSWVQFNGGQFAVHMLSSASLQVYHQVSGKQSEHVDQYFDGLYKRGRGLLCDWFKVSESDIPVLTYRVGLSTPLPKNAKTFRHETSSVLKIN